MYKNSRTVSTWGETTKKSTQMNIRLVVLRFETANPPSR